MRSYSAVAGYGSEKYIYLGLWIYVFNRLKLHLRKKKKKFVMAARVCLQIKQQQILICYFFPQIKAEIIITF